MIEKVGGLLGLVVACAVAVAAIVLIVQAAAGELLPDRPGDEISGGDDDWLIESPRRTLVDLGELRDEVFGIEAMLHEAIDEEINVEYRAILHPGNDAVIGATGETVVMTPPDPQRFAAVGFGRIEAYPLTPTVPSYPTSGPQPQLATPLPPPSASYPTAVPGSPSYPAAPATPSTTTTEATALVLQAGTPRWGLSVTRVDDEYHIHFSVILAFEDE